MERWKRPCVSKQREDTRRYTRKDTNWAFVTVPEQRKQPPWQGRTSAASADSRPTCTVRVSLCSACIAAAGFSLWDRVTDPAAPAQRSTARGTRIQHTYRPAWATPLAANGGESALKLRAECAARGASGGGLGACARR
jgi:hypothetical protein